MLKSYFFRLLDFINPLCVLTIIVISVTTILNHYEIPLRTEPLFCIVQLLIPLLYLSLLGFLILDRLPNKSFQAFLNPIHLATGQVILASWLYIRSFLNHFIFHIPFSLLDPAIPLVLFIVIATRNKEWSTLKSALRDTRSQSFFSLSLLLIAFVCLRELPREIMLSSDPDLHSFFTIQIYKFRTIPFQQEAWGPLPFGYPAGFPILVYMWSSLSGLSVLNSVQVMPFLQTSFALLGAVSFISALQKNSTALQFIVSATVVLGFWLVALPFGFNIVFFHLEGSGRSSSLLLLFNITAILILIIRTWKIRPNYALGAIALLAANMAILTLINPVNILLPGLFVTLVISALVYQSFKQKQKPLTLLLSISPLLLSLALTLSDPYFFGLIDGRAIVQDNPMDEVSSHIEIKQKAIQYFSTLMNDSYGSFTELFSFTSIPQLRSFSIYITLFVLIIFTGILSARSKDKFVPTLIIALFPAVTAAFYLALAPFLSVLPPGKGLYLLGPYFFNLCHQALFLWTSVALSFLMIHFCSINTLFILPFIITLAYLPTDSSRVNLQPRYNYCGSMGCVSDDDKTILQQIETFSQLKVTEALSSQHKAVPKILILNIISRTNGEEWLFPFGAARILPLYNTMPLAFYYNQGNQSYSFQSYQKHVCPRFDKQWLRNRNIRFAFLPSDVGPVCLGALADIAQKKENVIFESGKAKFIKLF
ncbi:MAG: hypothetical protein GYA55_12040 [SAR324 cluster bacterium]|uniref:Glycosyltransferase RgtA/B/C/D-like domain-containing protein n=1 Tax=SAR324 cluster bacterium TaxID=2024889 RepID=A0A7X9IL85_9DELT|nr:hypothetical protein [SAR324 cluster bacterium]